MADQTEGNWNDLCVAVVDRIFDDLMSGFVVGNWSDCGRFAMLSENSLKIGVKGRRIQPGGAAYVFASDLLMRELFIYYNFPMPKHYFILFSKLHSFLSRFVPLFSLQAFSPISPLKTSSCPILASGETSFF